MSCCSGHETKKKSNRKNKCGGHDRSCSANNRRDGVTQIFESATLDAQDRIVQILGEDVELTLPNRPTNGQNIDVIATEAATILAGCNEFCGTDAEEIAVAACSKTSFSFIECEGWIVTTTTPVTASASDQR